MAVDLNSVLQGHTFDQLVLRLEARRDNEPKNIGIFAVTLSLQCGLNGLQCDFVVLEVDSIGVELIL